jgi:phage shock protein PspC (stress-responsive transcriptional regulator)
MKASSIVGEKLMSEDVRRLYRLSSDQMVGGVCSGLGCYFEIDPTVMRLLFIAGFFLNPPTAAFLYLVLLVLVPVEPSNESSQV